MLEIAEWSWSNFLSYGDYLNTVSLNSMKQCLISGIIENEDGELLDNKSNGAGKSAIITALQWILFGRTSHNPNPGDKILNRHTKGDCWGRVVLTNGDSIYRIRRRDGSTEVTYNHSGLEECVIADTLSTLKAQQARINQVFKLDWDLFSKTVFFSMFHKPWLQMPDQQRKNTLEKLFRLDRFKYYSNSAANRSASACAELEKNRSVLDAKLQNLNQNLANLQQQKDIIVRFEEHRNNRLDSQRLILTNLHNSLATVPNYDYPSMKELWDKYNVMVNDYRSKTNELNRILQSNNSKLYSIDAEINQLLKDVGQWKAAEGKICSSCAQVIDSKHVCNLVNPKEQRIIELQNSKLVFVEQNDKITKTVNAVNAKLESEKPTISLDIVVGCVNQANSIRNQIVSTETTINSIMAEQAPNDVAVTQIEQQISRIQIEIDECNVQIEHLSKLIHHYEYIKSAYSDRRKIKNSVLKDYIPFINERIDYYLDILDLDVRIKLTDSLGIESNAWTYDFQSNGERSRTDVAVMLATYDMHEQLYNRQCNILVLDEVDGLMDDSGIQSLTSIIKNDLASRVDTVFVISHRDRMKNVFGSEIIARKRGSLSYLEK